MKVDFLQKSANNLGAYGATGFGAGFGGSCYAIVERSGANRFADTWKKSYMRRFPRYETKAQFDIYPASSGAHWEAVDG